MVGSIILVERSDVTLRHQLTVKSSFPSFATTIDSYAVGNESAKVIHRVPKTMGYNYYNSTFNWHLITPVTN